MTRTRFAPAAVLRCALPAALLLLGGAAPAACAPAAASGHPPPGVTVDAGAAAALASAGRQASLAVLPTIAAGRAVPEFGEVVALTLEQRGMTNLSLPVEAFVPSPDADIAARAAALGAFVRQHANGSDYTLFTQFDGTPGKSIDSIAAIIVDRAGRVAWCELLARGQQDFDRAKIAHPIHATAFVAARLRPVLSLGDPDAGAKGGPVAERMRRAGGVPSDAEIEAIDARTKAFAAECGRASILVVPTRVRGAWSAESAARIAEGIAGGRGDAAQGGSVRAASSGPTAARPSTMSQQRVVWALAHELSQWVRSNAPDADYILMSDQLFDGQGVFSIEIVVCDRSGAIAFAGLFNEQQKAFRSNAPRTVEACDRLVVDEVLSKCAR